MSWNQSAESCQPCASFKALNEFYGGNAHECIACHEAGSEGTVSFCENCHTDHHRGGYQKCAGTKAGITTCPRNHPLCAPTKEEGR